MKINRIIIVLGEPNSTFSEILFKYFNSKEFFKNKKKIIIIGSLSLLKKQIKILKIKLINNFKIISNIKDAQIKKINIININYNNKKKFSKISYNSRKYISNCFELALHLIKNNKETVLINGPI